ncbi:MAG: type II toxin-antitoxin system VapC family toxin [Gemmatimonadetes bacterium]|nr:type II toxin-antitoxin system VapC family toxin [Gemmatimonadota bacterium]MXY82978.1 type II toxin-antitoxin system VapC family toxin [Gemmatimonadota bacterium]MYB70167.1 type II toxin-antitoxin system VapC family toxin [Gemmatimonadota bacterium]
MMIADTSALMAVLMDEPEGSSLHNAMVRDGTVLVSTGTAVELMIVALGKDDAVYQSAVQLLGKSFIRLTPLDETQMRAAVKAYQRFGKGRHPASLNFGDTFAYALATTRRLPLLFKGDDFVQTDIVPVV